MTKIKYSIVKEFKFEASHRLYNLGYDSDCSNIHGHSYKVKLKLTSSTLNDQDMVIDFTHLSPIKNWINEQFDHALIISKQDKELINFAVKNNQKHYIIINHNSYATAENMAEIIASKTLSLINNNLLCKNLLSITVKIWETSKNTAIYEMNF